MSPSIPTGPLSSVAGPVVRRAKVVWDHEHERSKLIARVSAGIRQDDSVPYTLRDELAAKLPDRIRVEPGVQRAVSALLGGVDAVAAEQSLADQIARVCADLVDWPANFSADAFGAIAAAHAASVVNEVKATDREAAHVDAVINRGILSQIRAAVSTPEVAPNKVGALLRGPLEQIGQQANLEAALELQSDGHFAEAAELSAAISGALEEANLAAAAVTFQIWTAQLLAAAGEKGGAQVVLERMAWTHMDTPLHTATLSAIAELRRVGCAEWLVRGLEAAESWPRAPWAAAWLEAAIANDDRPDAVLRWTAVRVTIAAVVARDRRLVLELTDGLDAKISAGVRLDVELDRLDAVEAVQGRKAADASWNNLTDWVEIAAPAGEQARAWQRWGRILAARGDLDATRRAFRKSLRVWEQTGTSPAQAADAIFSLWHAESLLGDQTIDMTDRAIATNLRAAAPPSNADALLHLADALRLAEDSYRAHGSYWKALAQYHAAGDLQAVHLVQSRLADLYNASNRPEAALELALDSGSATRAVTAAKQLDLDAIDRQLLTAVAPWQEEAAYEVLIHLGTRASVATVAAFVAELLEDSIRGPEVTPSQRRPAIALEALARVALQVPDHTRGAVFARLRDGLNNDRLINAGRACADALLCATQIGITDAREILIDQYLTRDHSEGADYLTPADAAALLADDGTQRHRMVDAAAGQSRQATRALVHLTLTDEERASVEAAADNLARESLEENVRTGDDSGWMINMSARFEEGGMAAVYATAETRHALLIHLVSIVDDDDLPESVRGSAMRASHPLVRLLASEDLAMLTTSALKAARGEYVHSSLENPQIDPLSNVRDPADTAGWLQATGLTALGIIEQLDPGRLQTELNTLIPLAITHPQPWVRQAALQTLGRVTDVTVEIDIGALVADPSPFVREEVLKASQARNADRLATLLWTLASDPSSHVRTTVLALARGTSEPEIVDQIADNDEDAFLRGLAAIGREELSHSDPGQTGCHGHD